MKLSYAGTEYDCTKAIKGPDFVLLYQDSVLVLSCLGVTDFSGFVLTGGEWSDPAPAQEVIATSAALNSGSIRITAPGIIGTGTVLKFTAPCTCASVTGGLVVGGITYEVVNAMGCCVTGIGGVWDAGAQVSVLLDKAGKKAYVQNAVAAPPYTYGTEDLVAGESPLPTGRLYLVYE